MTTLRQILDRHEIPYRDLAVRLGIHPSSLSQYLSGTRELPKKAGKDPEEKIIAFLNEKGASAEEIAAWRPDTHRPAEDAGLQHEKEDTEMLLRRQPLEPETLEHFDLARDPFSEDVLEPADVYLDPNVRRVREAIWHCARHGGFLAVVGESGAGKSVLRRDLAERAAKDAPELLLARPYTIGMEESEKRGETLRVRHIEEALCHALNPNEPVRQSAERRHRQVHEMLREKNRDGARVALLIDEAHALPKPTLRHLKRMIDEFEEGLRPLLGVLLFGQTELGWRLAESDASIREVTQRIRIVTLAPLDNRLEEYLTHKFARIGADVRAITAPEVVDAIRLRLTGRPAPKTKTHAASLVYPLAVNNLLGRAMNDAARAGEEKVTGAVIEGA